MKEDLAAGQRAELLKAKDELIKIMREIINPINIIACRLDEEATKLLPAAIEETANAPARQHRNKTENPTDPNIKLPSNPSQVPKRACSICRKPGHRATTCPERG